MTTISQAQTALSVDSFTAHMICTHESDQIDWWACRKTPLPTGWVLLYATEPDPDWMPGWNNEVEDKDRYISAIVGVGRMKQSHYNDEKRHYAGYFEEFIPFPESIPVAPGRGEWWTAKTRNQKQAFQEAWEAVNEAILEQEYLSAEIAAGRDPFAVEHKVDLSGETVMQNGDEKLVTVRCDDPTSIPEWIKKAVYERYGRSEFCFQWGDHILRFGT